ncbi:MAG: hypothetical protein WBV82_26465, partial [Myxococcaceae bacterium]
NSPNEVRTTLETRTLPPVRKRLHQRFALPAALLLLVGGGAMTFAFGRSTPGPSTLPTEHVPAPVATTDPAPDPAPAHAPRLQAVEKPSPAPPAKRTKKRRAARKPAPEKHEKPAPEALSPGFLADPFEGR